MRCRLCKRSFRSNITNGKSHCWTKGHCGYCHYIKKQQFVGKHGNGRYSEGRHDKY